MATAICLAALATLLTACQTQVTTDPTPAVAARYLVAEDSSSTLSTMDEGGLNKKVLVHDGITPNWTPDGKIIFIARRGSPQIWIMNADGSGQRQISKFSWSGGEAVPLMPQQGKNGVIIFHVHSGLTPEIRSIQADGSGEKTLVAADKTPSQPSLAMSGTWLTYTIDSPPPIHREIHRINIDGSGDIALTSLGDPDYPDANASNISPDEKFVAFFSGAEQLKPTDPPQTQAYRNIAIVPSAGGSRTLITGCVPVSKGGKPCAAADNPFWLPDGRIGYDRDDGKTWASALPSGGAIVQPTQILPLNRGTVRVVVKP